MNNQLFKIYFLFGLIFTFTVAVGQNEAVNEGDTLMTVSQCIEFALQNQPQIQQSHIDQEIADRTIKANLAMWLPQVNLAYTFQDNILLPVSFIPKDFSNPSGAKVPARFGLPYVSTAAFQASQVLFNNSVFVAAKGASATRNIAKQNTATSKADLVVNVTKAFYNILVTEEQIKIIAEDITRQKKLLEDARNQYEAGIVDKLDYKRTNISLNNSLVQKRRAEESLVYKYSFLKEMMGYPIEKHLSLSYERMQVQKEALLDSLVSLDVEKRPEYQVLQSQLKLQELNHQFNKLNFIPSVSGFFNYNIVNQSQQFSEVFNRSFPNSAVGLTAALPIFQGTARLQNLQKAKLLEKRARLDLESFTLKTKADFDQVMGIYKSNLLDLRTQMDNVQIAREVYEIVKLQYDEGITPYINVISAESDLQAAEVNYLNALFNLVSSKLDVERVAGLINY
jgi:outer membrane protein TolC